MPDANRDAIHAAVAAGIHVALVTGRSYPFARPVADTLPASISLIVSNGAVERGMDGSTLARRLLDRDVARRCSTRRATYRDAAALIFDRDADRQVVFETMDWEHPGRQSVLVAQQLADRAVGAARGCAGRGSDSGDVQRRASIAMRALAELCADAVAPPAEASTRCSLTEYVHRDFSLVDVTAPDATKGRALAWRAEQLGLARDEVMAVGDNFNDLEMLEFAGTAGGDGERRRGAESVAAGTSPAIRTRRAWRRRSSVCLRWSR